MIVVDLGKDIVIMMDKLLIDVVFDVIFILLDCVMGLKSVGV